MAIVSQLRRIFADLGMQADLLKAALGMNWRDVPVALAVPETPNVIWLLDIITGRPAEGRAFRVLGNFNREGLAINRWHWWHHAHYETANSCVNSTITSR